MTNQQNMNQKFKNELAATLAKVSDARTAMNSLVRNAPKEIRTELYQGYQDTDRCACLLIGMTDIKERPAWTKKDTINAIVGGMTGLPNFADFRKRADLVDHAVLLAFYNSVWSEDGGITDANHDIKDL